jgi:hypothetical protein
MKKCVVFTLIVSIVITCMSCGREKAKAVKASLEGLITAEEVAQAVGFEGKLEKSVRNVSQSKTYGQIVIQSPQGSLTFRCEITVSELTSEGEFERWCNTFFKDQTPLKTTPIADESRAALLGTHGSRLAFRKGQRLIDIQLFCSDKLVRNITPVASLLDSRL